MRFGLWICFLAPVVGPGLLGQGEFGGGEFAGGGGGHECQPISLIIDNTTQHLTMKIPFWRFGLISAIIVTLIFLSGCTEKPVSEPEIVSEYPAEIGEQFYPITMGESIRILNSFFSEDMDVLNTPVPVYYFHADGVNNEGKAEQWIIGTKVKNEQYFVIVESNRQVLIPYHLGFPEKVIDTTKIVYPDTLIAKNNQILKESFGEKEKIPSLAIELMGNTYTVTSSTDSGTKIRYFDASTGIPLNF